MRRILALLVCLVIAVGSMTLSVAAQTVTDIDTKEELSAIRNNLSGQYRLTADIAFTAADFAEGGAYYNNGKGFIPIGNDAAPFTGTLDGNGYTISGLVINHNFTETEGNQVGLFGRMDGMVKNLRLYDFQYTYTVTPSETVVLCYNYMGGIAGRVFGGTIEDCAVYGAMDTTTQGFARMEMGGIAGYNSGTIRNCYVKAELGFEMNTDTWTKIGGIAGHSESNTSTDTDGLISDCFCDITWDNRNGNTVYNYLSVGDLIGRNTNADCTDGYYVFQDTAAVGEGVYNLGGSAENIQSVLTAEVGDQNKFSALDFANHWKITDGGPVPSALNCFDPSGDLYCDICGVLMPEHVHDYTITEATVETFRSAASCTEAATYYKKCSCGQISSTEFFYYQNPLNHIPGELVVDTPATCSATGLGHKECTVCDKLAESGIVIAVDVNAHKWEDEYTVDTPATCNTAGSESIHCEYCDTKNADSITPIAATGNHISGDWVVVKQPTATMEGKAEKRCTVCEMLLDTKKIDKVKPAVNFTDVKKSDFFYNAVQWAVSAGVTSGTSKTTFGPEEACTRAQAVTFLWRAAGSPAPKSNNNPFTDVKKSDYYYKAVLWAVENGVTAGTSKTTFSPEESCTRGQIVTFLWRAEGGDKVKTSNPFKDVKKSDYYYNAVLWAVENGVTAGATKTTFAPNDTCTRGQIVTFLYRAIA